MMIMGRNKAALNATANAGVSLYYIDF